MKKTALLIIAILIIGSFGVSATEIIELTKWTTSYGAPTPMQQVVMGDSYVPVDKTKNYTELASNVSFDGKYSMKLCYPKAYQNYTNMQFKNNYVSNMDNGNYTVEFYLKGNYNESSVMAGLGNNKTEETGSVLYLSDTRFEKEKAGEWTKYSAEVSYNKSYGEYFIIMVEADSPLFYVDGISVTSIGGTNMLENGDFENVNITRVFDDIEYDERKPRNPLCSYGSSVLNLTWENASAEGIKNVSLYDITSEKKLISDEIDTASGVIASVDYSVSDTSLDYLFEIVTTFDDDEKTSFYFSKEACKVGCDTGSWAVEFTNYANVKYRFPIRMNLDGTQAYEGDTSLKIISHPITQKGNYYVKLTKSLALDIGSTYRFSAMVRGRDTDGISIRYSWNEFSTSICGKTSGNYDWTLVEGDLKIKENMTTQELIMIIERNNKEMWIDDLKLYKVEEGKTVGDNLITDASFENASNSASSGEVDNINTTVGDKCASISWKNPTSEIFKKVRLYDVTSGKNSLIGEYSQNSIKFENLENDKKYNLILKTVSKQEIESDGEAISITPVQPNISVSELKIKNNGVDADKLTQGDYTATVSVSNNKNNVPVTASLITVLYKGEELIGIIYANETIGKGETKELKTEISVPDTSDADYKMEIHLWDDLYSLNRLTKKTILNEKERM